MIMLVLIGLILLSLILCVVQLLITDCNLTKILALDLLSLFVILLMGILALNDEGGIFYLDIGLLLALSAFIGTIAFTKMSLLQEESDS